jgi:NAD(P) transhydrogenase subunit alpha
MDETLKEAVQSLQPVALTASEQLAQANLSGMLLLLFTFVLAIFLGFELIVKVPSQLHTPLMSGANAISGISIVGALLATQYGGDGILPQIIAFVAVACASVNVVGGYLVTNRMLSMFQAKKGGK